MQDLISVIIPIYNVEKYLRKCIDSVINQTYRNIEIILVNDGSPDNCKNICEEYKEKDNRIIIINKENGGLSDARNAGIDIANGKYIAFIDSDDYVTDDYIEFMYNLIKDNDVNMAMCNVQVVWKNMKIKEILNEESVETELLTSKQAFYNLLFDKGGRVCAYAKLYKKDLFNEIRFPKGRVYEDTAIMYKIIDNAKKIAFGNKCCYYYVARKGSISKQAEFNKNEQDYIDHTFQMLDYIEKNYPDLKSACIRFNLYARFRILRMLIFSKKRNKIMEKEYIKEIKKNQIEVFKHKDTPKIDKIAIILLNMGLPIFKASWWFYCRCTGRII